MTISFILKLVSLLNFIQLRYFDLHKIVITLYFGNKVNF